MVVNQCFGLKAEEILKQPDEISWPGYTLGSPPPGPFTMSIKDTDYLQQMTLPWGLVAELCAGLVAWQVPCPLQVPVGFSKGQVSVDVRAGAFTVCVQRHAHVHRCTQYNTCMHHTHAHIRTHMNHTCAHKGINHTHTCTVIGTHDTHMCVHTCTKQYTHTHKITHIAYTCTHTYGHKPALFLILSVSVQHCHLFSLCCWKMFAMISSVPPPLQAGWRAFWALSIVVWCLMAREAPGDATSKTKMFASTVGIGRRTQPSIHICIIKLVIS